MPLDDKSLRTRVYIDGFNLYYGCLKYTSFKWLDLYKLFFDKILNEISKSHQENFVPPINTSIKYFTAEITRDAAKSNDSVECQRKYLRALEIYSKEDIEIIKGKYKITTSNSYVVDAENPKKIPRECQRQTTWKIEEKQSDVNIAIHAYHDAIFDNNIDQVVIVSNDTDLIPAINFIKNNTDKKVGLIIPSRDKKTRRTNADLSKAADWTLDIIKNEYLRESELPRVIPGSRKPCQKPDSWYPNPDIFKEIIETLIKYRNTRGEAFKWLNYPQEDLDGRIPIEMLENELEIKKVLHLAQKQYFLQCS